ncbi:COP9 signalosome subunit 6 [Vararia minispora EC-137]|uniref:COP9 signalosome subunit 6 n=1 Tax=Vararia minispora EC-137 TaxID=1314806 RepID=A0ACB8QBX5_9AGAM|nr:COP9 signalosome subunit 6 [Vararia minispora EC-137]
MTTMDTDEPPVVLPPSVISGLSLAVHPLPILNISEHLTRLRLATRSSVPFVIGALLGTQNGREVEIVNSFELILQEGVNGEKIDHEVLRARAEQYKQVFPSLEFIGWYTVAAHPTVRHIALNEQLTAYSTTPILLVLQPTAGATNLSSQHLPLKAYEPTIDFRDGSSRSVFTEAPFTVETGEAERIAVDWTARGGEGGTSLESHLSTQRAAVKMLHDRIAVLVHYVKNVMAGTAPKDHVTLRALSALLASLPSSDSKYFREEFDTEYEDVQLTAYLSTLTKSANALNDLVDKHLIMSAGIGRDEGRGGGGPRRKGAQTRGFGAMGPDWDRGH